jgi:ribosomal protein S18 acetylase RimI-like enzyme
MAVRPAATAEFDQLAWLWHQSWNDAHGKIAPEGLVRARTVDSFRDRLAAALPDMRVAGPVGSAAGLCIIKDDELYQLFVAREARGSGIAAALLADGEARLAARGVTTAWLACALGNDRAARFYEKCGWTRARSVVSRLEAGGGVFEIEVWRYEKAVR